MEYVQTLLISVTGLRIAFSPACGDLTGMPRGVKDPAEDSLPDLRRPNRFQLHGLTSKEAPARY